MVFLKPRHFRTGVIILVLVEVMIFYGSLVLWSAVSSRCCFTKVFFFLACDGFLCRNYDSLDESSVEDNIQLAFDVAEREFGIPPLMTVDEMSSVGEPDSLSMVMYLSQFYQLLREPSTPAGETTNCILTTSNYR